jgi:hypothetical protein
LVGLEPIFALNHSLSLSSCSSCNNEYFAIVGGHVYRGPTISSINGSYIFAESYSATVFVLSYTSDPFNNTVTILGSLPKAQISTFGLDKDGELYFADYKNGYIYGLMSNTTEPSESATSSGTETSGTDTGSSETGSTETSGTDTGSSDTGSSETGSTDTAASTA